MSSFAAHRQQSSPVSSSGGETLSSVLSSAALALASATLGSLFTYWIINYRRNDSSTTLLDIENVKRRRLPKTIILVRHGQSEANADHSLWNTIPDNLVGLTESGAQQAAQIGKRIETILDKNNCQLVHLVVSPFERTLQTAYHLRKAIEHRIVRTDIESRIREQEMGNLQGTEFAEYRKQQRRVGRFWFRFPTGESGADVLDRVKSWWFESILTVNRRLGFDPIDAVVVVTHGLTMRFILMQLFGWSPTTFHSVWNAGNCDVYVLQKDESKPGVSPYVLDSEHGDTPRSTIDVMVEFGSTGEHRILKLEDYLSVPPPRTTRIRLVKKMLAEQYGLDAHDMHHLVFMPFVEGRVIKGRSTSGKFSASEHGSSEHGSVNDDFLELQQQRQQQQQNSVLRAKSSRTLLSNTDFGGEINRNSHIEMSGRFPCVKL